ncbi:hypothetical protein F5Y14DRAFT_155080 [Nemania sp. NC0429]|nr:hypothetical protein F5Y14DRAFT_155080 [Nemania sp. NC0429]
MDAHVSPSPSSSPPGAITATATATAGDEGDGATRSKEKERTVAAIENDTIARLHYRRSKIPGGGFAELECLVPLDSAVYVSIHDPLRAPAFRPRPAKPLPDWMRFLPPPPPERNCRDPDHDRGEEEARPRSILDAHFPPASSFARPGGGIPAPSPSVSSSPLPSSRVHELERNEPMATEIPSPRLPHPHRAPPPSAAAAATRSPVPATHPPSQPRPPSRESISSCSSENLGSAESIIECHGGDRSVSSPVLRFPVSVSASTSLPPPYQRSSVVVDEPVKRPLPQLTQLRGEAEGSCSGCGAAGAGAGTSGTNPPNHVNVIKVKRETRTISQPITEGKAKSVAWDETVQGGDSESEIGRSASGSGSASSCDDYRCMPLRLRDQEREREREREREHAGLRRAPSPLTPPRRRPSPISAVWRRVVGPRTPTPPQAQAKESFVDLCYADDKPGPEPEPRARVVNTASMAVAGRRRGKEVAGAGIKARACSKCGNVSD